MSSSNNSSDSLKQDSHGDQANPAKNSVLAKPANLREIINESVEAPTRITYPTQEEYEETDQRRIKLAQELAKRLYELTNVERVTELETYLEAINSVVLDSCSEENQFILSTMQEYFTEVFGFDIRRLGHSPEVEDQIVHRTGKDTREIVKKTLSGFNVKSLAQEIRSESKVFSEEAPKVAARLMYDLTHNQVLELRSHYATLAAKEIAEIIHYSLFLTNSRGKPEPDIDTLEYILIYRSAKELAQIECQYNHLFHFNRNHKKELCLREKIKSVTNSEETQKLFDLLNGFQPNQVADRIFDCLSNYIEISEGLNGLEELKTDFASRFRQKKSEAQPWEKELAARSEIEHLIMNLSEEQFNAVKESLRLRYDIDLTDNFYPLAAKFRPRKVALDIYKSCLNVEPRAEFRRAEQYLSERELLDVKDEYRLSKNNELSDIIRERAAKKKIAQTLTNISMALSPLKFLTPDQLQLVKKSFQNVAGISLEKFVKETSEYISHRDTPESVTRYVDLILSGTARQSLSLDIFHLFRNKAKRERELEYQSEKSRLESELPALARVVSQQASNSPGTDLLGLLAKYNPDELHILEEIFIEKNETDTPFIKGLESIVSEDLITDIKMMFANIDLRHLVEEIHACPHNAASYLRIDTSFVKRVVDEFKANYDISIYDYVRSRYSKKDSKTRKQRTQALLFFLAPEAEKIFNLVQQCKEGSFQEERILSILQYYKDDAQALEGCYNLYYNYFDFSYNKNANSLIYALRALASSSKISRELMSKAMLIFEGVPSHISEDLHALLSKPSISNETLAEIHELLRTHYKYVNTIHRSYNALDADLTIRERLYQLQLPLDDINETILICDGYDPAILSDLIHKEINVSGGESLGNCVIDLLSPSEEYGKEQLVPTDPNWTSEMFHQVRRCYQRMFGSSIIADLIEKEVPLKGRGINAIAYKLYGATSTNAIDLYNLIKSNSSAEQVTDLLNKLQPRLRNRVIEMYDDYVVSLGYSEKLINLVESLYSGTDELETIQNLITEAEQVILKKENTELPTAGS